MEFVYKQFRCDVDVFRKDDDIVLRFYDKTKEQDESKIHNLVIVDPGYGFICLKVKGDCGLISGFLEENVFISDDMIESAVEFIKDLAPKVKGGYIPYHVELVKMMDYVEYNGELQNSN